MFNIFLSALSGLTMQHDSKAALDRLEELEYQDRLDPWNAWGHYYTNTRRQEFVFMLLYEEHQKHWHTASFSSVICRDKSKKDCYKCWRDKKPDCPYCKTGICKCLICGILCHATIHHEIVNCCTCGRADGTELDPRSYEWFDGYCPKKNCNKHNAPHVTISKDSVSTQQNILNDSVPDKDLPTIFIDEDGIPMILTSHQDNQANQDNQDNSTLQK